MGTLVSVLAITAFTQSIILVLVSATATGIFGLIICLIQTHSEARLHERLDHLESRATEVVEKTEQVQTTTDQVSAKADEIAQAVTPTDK